VCSKARPKHEAWQAPVAPLSPPTLRQSTPIATTTMPFIVCAGPGGV
jgi:hypothetical protein